MAIDDQTAGVTVRVVDADVNDSGELHVTLAVPEAEATRIAQLAATDRLVVIGLPTVITSAPAPIETAAP
jgi:hypothetical protein